MPQPNVYWFYNQGTNDVAKTAGPAEDANFKLITAGASGHLFAPTGQAATDGDPANTRDNIVVPDSGSVEVDETYIDNGSTIEQVPLAGTNQGKQSGGATRYPFCVHFDGPTSGPVYLECWDNSNHNTINSKALGSGTPDNSFIKGIATTGAGPINPDWVAGGEAKSLAGSADANRLILSATPLTGPTELYFNLAIRVPAGAGPFNANPVFALRFDWI
ncbi:MAG TPA: hypothetical protein ACFYED_09050 [Candidatus Tripitaka californicus]|uniref:hypothetical protein n=1 Tax=Candidatus Tripitaka californicus TaxID=3367616 RepID=UPI00402722C8|nr:hypothetical protein [Planctomycetota bacterium]